MTIVTTQYQRKPFFVDAVQVTAENFIELAQWCQGEIISTVSSGVVTVFAPESGYTPADCHIRVRVHNPINPRQTKAFVGDWILYTEQGYKIYNSKSFRKSFDPVNVGQTDVKVEKTPDLVVSTVSDSLIH